MSSTNGDIVEEFRTALNDAAAVFGVGRSGLPIVYRELDRFANLTSMKPADLVHLSIKNDDPDQGPADSFAAWPLERLPHALSPDGTIAQQIGHQWVVHVYHLWEDFYRNEIALSRGFASKNQISNPHFGDLAKIRHDILKHRGIASSSNTGKCVNLNWFAPGGPILIQDHMVYEFMEAFGVVFPGQGDVDPAKVIYPFHGLIASPLRFSSIDDSSDHLVANIRSLSGRNLDISLLCDRFCGTEFIVEGPGGAGSAFGVAVHQDPANEMEASIIVRTSTEFATKVRSGEATARLAIGSAMPDDPLRAAVQAVWLRDSIIRVEATAPQGRSYDDTPFRNDIGGWIALASNFGDLYEGKLINVEYADPDARVLRLDLQVSPAVAEMTKSKNRILSAILRLGTA